MVRPRSGVRGYGKVGFGLGVPECQRRRHSDLVALGVDVENEVSRQPRDGVFMRVRLGALVHHEPVDELNARILIEDGGVDESAVLLRRDPVKRFDGNGGIVAADISWRHAPG